MDHQKVSPCHQVTLNKLVNSGVITDVLTSTDEIELLIGVDQIFALAVEQTYFEPGGTLTFSSTDEHLEGKSAAQSHTVSFPCFSKSAFWVKITEVDTFRSDTVQVSLDCKNL